MKIYNVFHPNFLWKALRDQLSGQINKLELQPLMKNEEEWEVEDIFDITNL